MNKLFDRKDFLLYRKYVGVNEVFTNEIPWGDSLIGRLINSISRKSKIAFDMGTVDGQVKRLRSLFDQLIETGYIEVSEDDRRFLAISQLLGELKKSVYSGEDVGVLINLTTELIGLVRSHKFDKKNYMISALNDFLKFLIGLGSNKELETEVKDDKGREDFYQLSRKLLKSLIDINDGINSNIVKFNPKVDDSGKSDTQTEYDRLIDEWREDQKKKGLNQDPGEGTRKRIKREAEKSIKESLENKDDQNMDGYVAWKRILRARKTSEIIKFHEYITKLLSISEKDKDKFEKAKSSIIDICKQTVMNRITVGKPISYQELVKENYSVNDVSKSISLFGRVLLSFDENRELCNSYGIVGKNILVFIDSFKSMEGFLSKKDDEKNESLTYTNFILIKERSEFTDQIIDKFDSVFTDEIVSYFQITEEKRSELESGIKKSESFLITDSDFIIQIVQIFNRSWRIHTPGVIPSGRSGGKVSNSVFREYDDLGRSGGTPDAPGSGPYRNKKLWDRWNQGVMDIMSDPKYRPIFSEDAVFSFKSEIGVNIGGTKKVTTEGDNIKKGGKVLQRFIVRLLSDSKMYGSDGALPKFMNEYFGLKVDEDQYNTVGRPNDRKNNFTTVDGIKMSNVRFEKWGGGSVSFLKKNMLFEIELVENKEIPIKGYFKIIDILDDSIYGVYANSFVFDRTNIIFDKDPIEIFSPSLRFIEVNKSDFVNGTMNGRSFKMKEVDAYDDLGIINIKIQIKNTSILLDPKSDPYLEISKIKGSKNYGVPSELIRKFKMNKK
jgi:hypothetical protein